MAKQSGGKPQIDEDFMKEIISQGLPVKKQETPMVAIPTEVKTKAETPDIPANVPEQEPKRETENVKEEKAVKEPARRKKNAPGDYRETYFMRVDLTDRQPLYVSRTTHEKLMKINRYRRTQGNRQQLCRKYPPPAFRPVSGRDKRTVRKQI